MAKAKRKATSAPKTSISKTTKNATKKARTLEIIRLLERYYPDAECALHHSSPEQLLIATILSAQCTDERVNQVTPVLFEQFPTVRDLAEASLAQIEGIIRPTGFYKNKAKSIKACCQTLLSEHDGKVPRELAKLVKLAGVGRKTANVVLGVSFGIASGIVVDTHVTRLSNRLGLVKGENAVQIERELIALVPKENWIAFSHWLITHGRKTCKARRPACETCFLDDVCPKLIR